jgi:hypothetical protein
MSALVSLFLCMTLIYFHYSAISCKVVLSCIGDTFLCSSSIHHLEARVFVNTTLGSCGISIESHVSVCLFSLSLI